MFLWVLLQTQASTASNIVTESSADGTTGVRGRFFVKIGLLLDGGAEGWSLVVSINYQVQSVQVCTMISLWASTH